MSSSSRTVPLRASLALSCFGSALFPLAAAAQTAPQEEEPRTLGGMTVTDTALDETRMDRQQQSPRAVRPIRDTPQTITVLGSEVLQQQNLISLQEALSTIPGITFGAGEGGGGYGDSITLRGYAASNDITTDNVRDSAQYSRTDTFNIEQVEVTNGANSVISGAGSVGGTINLVTKRPLARDQAIFMGGIGTDEYYRATTDISQHLTENIAVRLNAMYHHNAIPGRQVEENDRWGVAPSITLGIGGPTSLTLQYYHQEDDNIPQFGVPHFATPGYVGALPGVDRTAYYGFRNLDTQQINIDQFTMILDHQFSDTVKLRNLFRYQDITQFSIADGPEGIFCLPSGFTAPGVACATPGFFTPSGGSRGNTRRTRNQLSYNQTDLTAIVNTGGIEHSLDVGFSISRENYRLASGNSQRFANGAAATITPYDLYNPNIGNFYTGPVNFIVGTRNYNRVENYAVYLFDAMKLSDKVEVNAGVRWERNIGRSLSDTFSTTAGATFGNQLTATTLRNANSLFSYRVGLVYKPIETVSVYAAYGNSKTPSQNTVNGACTNNLTAVPPVASCNVRPESAKNYEIGAKAELFDNLLLTLAVFRNERNSFRVASGDPLVPDQALDGQSRVNGLSLGASGTITPNWTVTANYTYLDSKLIRSVSAACLAAPGSGNCTNTVAQPNPGGGSRLTQTPRHSGSLFTNYRFPFGLTVGYGATYQGAFVINTPSAAIPQLFFSQDYLVHNATISYDFSRALSAQVNIKNIGDKLYYTRIRANSGWATPGDARSAVFTLTYKM